MGGMRPGGRVIRAANAEGPDVRVADAVSQRDLRVDGSHAGSVARFENGCIVFCNRVCCILLA